MAKYVVTYERDEDGWWIAQVQGVAGVNSDGRTVADARRRVREALSLAIGDREAARAELVDDVRLPAALRKTIARATAARTKLDAVQAEAQETTATAARELRKRLGLSMRDVAELLGLSRQRIQQLAAAGRRS